MGAPTDDHEVETDDHAALRMMLSYVAAECARIGATEAARHATLAASLVEVPAGAAVLPRPQGSRVH